LGLTLWFGYIHFVGAQKKCSFFQLLGAWGVVQDSHSSIKLEQCTVHRGVGHLMLDRYAKTKVVKCTNCSGCQECKQPVPLVIPEGTGGSGCSAEVAAKAEALRATAQVKASHSQRGTPKQQQEGGTGGASASNDGDRGSSVPGSSGSAATAPVNSALVECAVCHRKPGDPGVPATLKLCGGCLSARYCSTECQRKDWKMGHKTVCQSYQGAKEC
jgi:hypothetical protein